MPRIAEARSFVAAATRSSVKPAALTTLSSLGMRFRVSSLQPFRNANSRWLGFLPVGSVEQLGLDEESEWQPSEDVWLGLRQIPTGAAGIVTRVHAGAASWTRSVESNEALVMLCACEVPQSVEDGVLDTEGLSAAFRSGISRCTSNYAICPLPAEDGDWVEIPCKGGWLMVNLYLLNPYSVSQMAIFLVSWGFESPWPPKLLR